MIVIENVSIYKCQYCQSKLTKNYLRKQDATKHENNCNYNHKNFSACSGCKFLDKIEMEYEYYGNVDDCEGPITRKTNCFYCKKLDQKMFPFKAVKKGLVKRFPDTFKDQIQMPSLCSLREEENIF